MERTEEITYTVIHTLPYERDTPYFDRFDTYEDAARFAGEIMSESTEVVLYIESSRREVWK